MGIISELMTILEAIDYALSQGDINGALKKTHEGIARLKDEQNNT